ncbi:hypothetical protein PROFUN_06601 [Planoprotostelium fungivorum]|uniref:Transmembrane protein n=1 Tax=Planoprotostelium fungivorum TaxID=1890364 RepID=A0A2P6MRZ5_9EUKA|nr:hypothetical protein PROFUN_06601 [Planoprotostelium fungivorum]
MNGPGSYRPKIQATSSQPAYEPYPFPPPQPPVHPHEPLVHWDRVGVSLVQHAKTGFILGAGLGSIVTLPFQLRRGLPLSKRFQFAFGIPLSVAVIATPLMSVASLFYVDHNYLPWKADQAKRGWSTQYKVHNLEEDE